MQYTYGPVLSRRFGRSLGIDPVPGNTCSYDCIYCQLGRTATRTTERAEYAPVDDVLGQLREALMATPDVDCVTIAGSGEPTLHLRLGQIIRGVRLLTSLPIVVITNGSLLWQPEVREALMAADIVVPSLDAGDSQTFHYVNRPSSVIDFETMVDGIATFTREFQGTVWLEVFMLAGVTSIEAEMRKIAALVERIGPARTQLNTATRPTAEEFAFSVTHERIASLAKLIPGPVDIVGTGSDEESTEAETGVVTDELLVGLLERHPSTVREMATALHVHPRAIRTSLDALDRTGQIRSVVRDGRIYYRKAER